MSANEMIQDVAARFNGRIRVEMYGARGRWLAVVEKMYNGAWLPGDCQDGATRDEAIRNAYATLDVG